MKDSILVLNAGSSSISFHLFAVDGATLSRQVKGQMEGIGTRPHLAVVDAEGVRLTDRTFTPAQVADIADAIVVLRDWLGGHLAGRLPMAVGHRVVHGGTKFDRPILIDDAVVAELEALVPLAPLHQPRNLAPIKAVRERLPDMPQVACFDTAFHRGHGELADRFALPESLHAEGIRSYGFHGLSYEYIAMVLPELAPEVADGRVVVAHLGSGASLCGLDARRSVESTMGFTALDGLPMGTRPGRLDPGVVLYLLTEKGMSGAQVQHLLYHECGLKGLSGISNDVRDLLASEDPRARMALDFFAHRAAQEVAGLATTLGGFDALIFTAGIGENSPQVRKDICARLAWLGVSLNDEANAANAPRISRDDSRPIVYVIPTDEERMLAEHTLALVGTAVAGDRLGDG
jgi:acetate kinase